MERTFERLQRALSESLDGLDEGQAGLRPVGRPAAWSIQQIVTHLTMTYSSTAEVFEKRLAKGSATRASPDLQQRLGQFVLLRLGYFPRNRKAPAMVTPPLDACALSGERLTSDAGELLTRLDGLIDDSARLFGGQQAISHTILGPLSATQWRRFHLLHGMRHVKQIRAIRSGHGI